MRILARIAALAAALAISFGFAALLPSAVEAGVGYVTIVVVLGIAFWWARRDGRALPFGDALRDWLVIAAVVAVLWRVALVLFEGSEDVVAQLRLDFVPVLSTIALIFVPALFGVLLGNGVRRAMNG